METIVQFLQPGDAFMARGQRHEIRHVDRLGAQRAVFVNGETADGRYFEATFDFGEVVDTI
jgi:hypothetical protein